MLIIDKFKDYYDYLTGIYGVDPKLVLDRRRRIKGYENYSERVYACPKGGYRIGMSRINEDGYCAGTIHVLSMAYDFLHNEKTGKTYYGEDMIPFCEKEKNAFIESRFGKGYKFGNETVYVNPYKSEINDFYDCPIMLNISEFPILSTYKFNQVMSAEEIFLKLSEYLSNKISENEKIVNNLTDVQRLESKGFDKKTSFRKM